MARLHCRDGLGQISPLEHQGEVGFVEQWEVRRQHPPMTVDKVVPTCFLDQCPFALPSLAPIRLHCSFFLCLLQMLECHYLGGSWKVNHIQLNTDFRSFVRHCLVGDVVPLHRCSR